MEHLGGGLISEIFWVNSLRKSAPIFSYVNVYEFHHDFKEGVYHHFPSKTLPLGSPQNPCEVASPYDLDDSALTIGKQTSSMVAFMTPPFHIFWWFVVLPVVPVLHVTPGLLWSWLRLDDKCLAKMDATSFLPNLPNSDLMVVKPWFINLHGRKDQYKSQITTVHPWKLTCWK